MPKWISFPFCLVILIFYARSAFAWGTVSITDGSGEQVQVKHGLFSKKTIVKDRYGDGFQHSRSIFGLTKDTQVGAIGNEVHVHKGLFGFGKTEGHDILGDSVSSSKNPLFSKTNIDLSGANNLVSKIFSKTSSTPQLNPSIPAQPGSFASPPVNVPPPVIDSTNKSSETRIPRIESNNQN
jgi:hypothetical protein